jgi:biopolymer transport protein ExbD
MQLKAKSSRRVQINITSLIDVMFILLIFFMVTSTFLEQPGMKLELPEAKTATVERIEKLVIFIDPDERIFVNDRPVTIDRLEQQLHETLGKKPDVPLVLRADQNVPHGLVVRVMDIAKKIGIRRIVIATKPGALSPE